MSLVSQNVSVQVQESLGTVEATVVTVTETQCVVTFSRFSSLFTAIVPLSWVRTKVSAKAVDAQGKAVVAKPAAIAKGAKVLVSMQIDTVVRRSGTVVAETPAYIMISVGAGVRAYPWNRVKEVSVKSETSAAPVVAGRAKAAPALRAPARR